jgi:hypothetical protein
MLLGYPFRPDALVAVGSVSQCSGPRSELLGIEHPILQAPMASAATSALAAAVSDEATAGR